MTERIFRFALAAVAVGCYGAGLSHLFTRGDWLTFAIFSIWGSVLIVLSWAVTSYRELEIPNAKVHRYEKAKPEIEVAGPPGIEGDPGGTGSRGGSIQPCRSRLSLHVRPGTSVGLD